MALQPGVGMPVRALLNPSCAPIRVNRSRSLAAGNFGIWMGRQTSVLHHGLFLSSLKEQLVEDS